MKTSSLEKGQGLVSYALILILFVGIVVCGVSYFFGIRTMAIVIAVIVGLSLLNALFSSNYVAELLRQVQMAFFILLTALHIYRPQNHAKWVQIDRIASHVHHFYLPLMKRRRVRLQIMDRPLPEAYANKRFVEDIFHHLISNAIKYSAKVPNSIIEVAGEVHSDTVRFTVTNHGVSIPENDSDKVFDWFFRARNSKKYGLGVGLSMVRFLATRMQGECGVTPDSSGRNIFWFTLPTN